MCTDRALLFAFPVFTFTACASPSAPETPNNRVTPAPIQGHPYSFRLDVYGDPFKPAEPGSDESNLPYEQRLRAGMRRYAAEKLRELDLCPFGFTGPDIVLAYERSRLHSFFFVDCLMEPPK